MSTDRYFTGTELEMLSTVLEDYMDRHSDVTQVEWNEMTFLLSKIDQRIIDGPTQSCQD